MSAQRLVLLTILVSPHLLACSDDDPGNQPMFSTGNGSAGDESSTGDETGDGGNTTGDGDGDGDPTTGDGDGDGDPTTGDGDGDPTTGDGDGDPGVCATPPGLAGSSCGQDAGVKGAVAMGETMADLPVGGVVKLDNGPGNGEEDWYRLDFPIDNANQRPLAGTIELSFALNEGGDYRFEIFRDCGAQPYGQGLAAEFGTSAPPLLEWTFNDLPPDPEQDAPIHNVMWPTSVWVRVFRFQNDEACSSYQLQAVRN